MTSSLVPRAESSASKRVIPLELLLAKSRQPFFSSTMLGMFGFLMSWAGSWVPSPWLDEAATAHIVSYPVRDMARLMQQTDAVYGPYYVLMHFWTHLVGMTPFTLRLPSLLAVGIGTAAMAIAGRTVGGPRAQILYALCFALLPRTAAMGIEARPYALSAMFMALALAAIVKLLGTPSRPRWFFLGLVMVGAVASQFFAVLPIFGMVLTALVLFSKRSRRALVLTSAVAALVSLPLATVAISQRNQVSWIGEGAYSLADQALVEAWFTSRWNLNPAYDLDPAHFLATFMAIVAGLTLVAALVSTRNLPKSRLALSIVPLLIAVLVLWGASLTDSPILLGRYLTPSTPFLAMLLAECIVLLTPHAKLVLLPLLVMGCVLLIVSQRQPYSKVPGQDYSFIASTLDSHSVEGEGLLIEPGLGPVDSARNAVDLYPKVFGRLSDISRTQREELSFVFASDPPVTDIAEAAIPARVWLVTKNGQVSAYAHQLAVRGYVSEFVSQGPGHSISSWSKSRT